VLEGIAHFKPDLLLHNGDIEKQETLNIYATLAPHFHVVQGDKDKLSDLPHTNVIKVRDVLVGQIHGDRLTHKERLSTFVNKLMRGHYYYWNNFASDALSQFAEKLDILVTGHLHIPFMQRINNTLIINPGAIVANGRAHHLRVPTLTTLTMRNSVFEIEFFILKEGYAPIPLLVGSNGPIKDRSKIPYQEPLCKPQVIKRSEM
jgi:putative phosphoesterase